MARPSFTLVLETENLGLAALEVMEPCLASLARQTLPVTEAARVVIVDPGRRLPPAIVAKIQERYPWLDVHVPTHDVSHYYDTKMEGARLAKTDVVVFADVDVVYEPQWLESILAPFDDPRVDVVAGVTLNGGPGVYDTSISLSWMAAPPPKTKDVTPAWRILANNFAARPHVMLAHPLPSGLPLYRAQILPFFRRLLDAERVVVAHPRALGRHRSPTGAREWFWRMAVLGSDLVVVRVLDDDGKEIRIDTRRRKRVGPALLISGARLVDLARRVRILWRDYPEQRRYVLPALPLALAGIAVSVGAGFVTVFDMNVVRRRVEAMEAPDALPI